MMLLNPYRFASAAPETEIGPTSLVFTQTSEISYFETLASELIDLNETFSSDTGQFTKYTEGTAGTTSISGNKMTVTHSGGANDVIKQNTTAITIPQLWVESWINVTSSGTSYDNGGVGIVKDQNNFLFASIDRLNNIIRIQCKISGTSTFLSSITQTFSTSFGLALSLVGNSACVWLNTGSGWTYATGASVSSLYDFRTTGALTDWNPGFTTANGGGTQVWAFSALRVGRFGAVGLRDNTIVTNEDGSPYHPTATSVLFTATASDPRGVGYCGVFSLDLTARTITQKAVIFTQRDGKSYGDLSAHVVYYSNGDRRITFSTWGNGFGGEIQVLHGVVTENVLSGTHLVSLTKIILPGQSGTSPGAYDTMAVYDSVNSRWLISYTLTTDTAFTGNPFFAALCSTTDWSTFTLIGADSSHNGYEGTKIFKVGGQYYIASGGPAGAGNSSRVYDTSMNYVGALDAVFHGGSDTQPHPMVFPYGDKQMMITYDNTKYASTAFTWGHVEIFEADRFTAG